MAKHLIILKCDGKCPFNKKAYWSNKRRCDFYDYEKRVYCYKEIPKGNFGGELFPKFCPLDDYEVEHCSKIQLKKKKMQDHIKKRKRCRK